MADEAAQNHDDASSSDAPELTLESKDDMEVRHRKEVKALDGEKRAAQKKAKATAGKKAKDLLLSIETEYDGKLQAMNDRHALELAALVDTTPLPKTENSKNVEVDNTVDLAINDGEQPEEDDENPEAQREKKQLKARRKREKQKEKERQRQQDVARETREAGPSLRQIEIEQLYQQLAPLHLKIEEVKADGHCLYRAVASQCNQTYSEIRNLCAKALKQHEEEFGAFVEFTDSVRSFDEYVEQVRSSSEWGGHVELRALSMALRRTIYVYSAREKEPLVLQDTNQLDDTLPPIRLSYHLHYYALGEHYNQVVETNQSEK